MAFLLLVTWVPAMLLLLLQAMFAGNVAFLREHTFLIPAITVFAFLQVLVASFASWRSRRSRPARGTSGCSMPVR